MRSVSGASCLERAFFRNLKGFSWMRLLIGVFLFIAFLAQAHANNSVYAGASYLDVSNGQTWDAFYVGATQEHETIVLYQRFERSQRYDLDDNEIMLGGYLLGDHTYHGYVTYSDTAYIKPDYRIFVEAHADDLKAGYVFRPGFKFTSNATTDAYSAVFALDHYVSSYRLSASATYSLLESDSADLPNTLSGSLTVDRYGAWGDDRDRLRLTVSAGEDAEIVPGGDVLVSDVFTVYLGGERWIAKDWAVGAGVTHHSQGDLYDYAQLDLSVKRAF